VGEKGRYSLKYTSELVRVARRVGNGDHNFVSDLIQILWFP